MLTRFTGELDTVGEHGTSICIGGSKTSAIEIWEDPKHKFAAERKNVCHAYIDEGVLVMVGFHNTIALNTYFDRCSSDPPHSSCLINCQCFDSYMIGLQCSTYNIFNRCEIDIDNIGIDGNIDTNEFINCEIIKLSGHGMHRFRDCYTRENGRTKKIPDGVRSAYGLFSHRWPIIFTRVFSPPDMRVILTR